MKRIQTGRLWADRHRLYIDEPSGETLCSKDEPMGRLELRDTEFGQRYHLDGLPLSDSDPIEIRTFGRIWRRGRFYWSGDSEVRPYFLNAILRGQTIERDTEVRRPIRNPSPNTLPPTVNDELEANGE